MSDSFMAWYLLALPVYENPKCVYRNGRNTTTATPTCARKRGLIHYPHSAIRRG